MNRRWVCNDVWMDTLPFFDRPQLGLKLALLSPRFNALVDKHFDGKRELTIWRPLPICKDTGEKVPKLSVCIGANSVPFPLPDRPLPDKIRFKHLQIYYIDHCVLTFLRANQQIWDRGTSLGVGEYNTRYIAQPIWNALAREILPIFAPNIRRLKLHYSDHLENLLRILPTFFSDLDIISIDSGFLLPAAIGDFDVPNANSVDQILSEWLHSPGKDGQPKRLLFDGSRSIELVNNFKGIFLRATNSSASYKIQFTTPNYSIEPFELVNGRTNEKLTLAKASEDKWEHRWIMKRCQIGETATIQWEDENLDDLNNVNVYIFDAQNCIVPLSPTSTEKEAGQSS